MYARLLGIVNRRRLDRKLSAFLNTPPSPSAPDAGHSLLSLVCERDVKPYLLAVKSMARFLAPRRVYAVNDGSLTAASRELLARHVGGLELLDMRDFHHPSCPSGGCWERLLAIAELSREESIVQMDSDIVVLREPTEVVEALGGEVAFTLGNWEGQGVDTMAHRRRMTLEKLYREGCHVQVAAEAAFDRLRDFDSLRYIRGCAGFAGFPKGGVDPAFIHGISEEFFGILGERWREWGTEQVMSNIVVANAARPSVLPFSRYTNCNNLDDMGLPSLVHFIGPCRFSTGKYRTAADMVLRAGS